MFNLIVWYVALLLVAGVLGFAAAWIASWLIMRRW